MSKSVQYDSKPIEIIARFILTIRNDPEFQKGYKDFLKRKDKRNEN